MKRWKLPRKILSLFAMTLAMLMLLTSTVFAADSKKTDPAPYTILRGGTVVLADYDTIRTDWNGDGCQLDTCFLTGESALRRLRLVFDGAYGLYDIYLAADSASTVDEVLYNTNYKRYGYSNLRAYLSDNTLNYYYAADGATLLKNLRRSSEYRNNQSVHWLVETMISSFESYYAPQLRRTLMYFCSETILQNMDFVQLKAMAAAIVTAPEYIQFRNTLYGHDCSTVKELMNYGYSLDYVARLYSDRAEAAVKALWPDYVDRVNAYWKENHSW